MIPGVQVFLYPEELQSTPADALAEQILAFGCDAASVAVVYHRSRRVLPRQGRVSVLTGSTTYFEPEPGRYGELVPAANGPVELRRRLFEFREACGRLGLGFRAWLVPLHNDALAAERPSAAARMLDGSPNGVGLCPSSPASVALAAGLVADVCAQLEPEAVELEALLYPAWEPAYTLTLALEPLPEPARLLASQCFCDACRDLLGGAADELEHRARESAGEPFGAGPWDEELERELATARARGGQRIVGAAADAAHAGGAAVRVFGSGPVRQAALQGFAASALAASDRLLLGCGALAGDEPPRAVRGPACARRWAGRDRVDQLVARADRRGHGRRRRASHRSRCRRARALQPLARAGGRPRGISGGGRGVPLRDGGGMTVIDGHATIGANRDVELSPRRR